ncbi:MAG: hypothetical protein ACJAS1_001781, partial [Oleiphilaceae bacterium]
GLVPWAILSGYDTCDQFSVGVFNTQADTCILFRYQY